MPDASPGRARYRRILRFAAWHLTVTWWYEILLPRIGLARVAERTRTDRMQVFARKFRVLAVDLGGLMIKLGQFMSSRLDVLPPEITQELEGLQDEVPPVPFDQMRALAEHELGVPLARVFAQIDEDPVAAASLGQAYRAQLAPLDAKNAGFDGVVVKIQRPGIEAIVDVDLAALRRVAQWLRRIRLVSDRADMPALVEEFATVSLEEIDYLQEGQNAERFAENFAKDDRVKVPAIVWERSTRRVLALEDVTAIKITDAPALRAAGIDPADVAKVFAEVMFDQLFVHGFFHADPHPGNLFIEPAAPGEDGHPWRLTFVDFGMMGSIPTALREGLRALIIAAASRDGRGMVQAMNGAGVLLPSADTADLERVMDKLFARFGGMGFAELRELDPREFRDFGLEFSDVVLTMPFQMPEDFLLVIRAVSLTSGVCSALDPAYNIWDSVEPYAQRLLRSQGLDMVSDLAKDALEIAQIAWRLPKRMDAVLAQAEGGTLAVTVPRLESAVARAERTVRRLLSALSFSALLIAGALVRSDDRSLGTVLMVASVVPLAHMLFGGRTRR
ncbi:AarF/UbiB family protein [Demequina sp.]|uniref:ABC1 kinase family protein n=1 Tax=Demequina sp. TaxID=2050685 RepID=UPI0025F146F0|nr:AarF/UbiB family protein [Demequina sp.]